MKIKLISVLVIVLFLCCSKIAASPAAINFDNLPKDEKFSRLFTGFENVYESICYSDFNHKDSKKEALAAADKLYRYLNGKRNLNYDENLSKLLVMRCLYNYDEITSAQIEKEFSKIEKAFPDNAEHNWIYGNYLVSAGKNLDGINKLEKYMKMKEYKINSFFIQDYAYAQMISGLPVNAYYSITNGGNIPENQVANQQLLAMIKNNLKESDVAQTYDKDEAWRISQDEDGFSYMYSTMLGISVPCKSNWPLRYSSFNSGSPAICALSPNDFTLEGKELAISFLVMAYPESYYSDQIKQKYLKTMNVINSETVKIDNKNFEKYTFEDLSKYDDARKGARGYLYYGKITPAQYSGTRIEHKIDCSKLAKDNDGQAKYFAIAPTQKRINEPVNIIIIVDSCNAVADETVKLVDEMFARTRFE